VDELDFGHQAALRDPKHFAFMTGVTLRGYSVQNKGSNWQVIFRGTRRNGEFVYSLFLAGELEEALVGLFKCVSGRQGLMYWHKDRFAA
jgi:hypothetical protein